LTGSAYLSKPESQRLVALYHERRKQTRQSFEAINAAAARGVDVTEQVMLKLLLHSDSIHNRREGARIHITPATTEDVKEWFQRSGCAKPTDWRLISSEILCFVRLFFDRAHFTGFQMEMLSPILNALRPDEFFLINDQSRQVMNYFADKSYRRSLTGYPAANATGHELIRELAEEMDRPDLARFHATDLFALFSRWLVVLKKFNSGTARFGIHREMYKRWPPLW
jgi:5-methylcytosine-specific restriction protein B